MFRNISSQNVSIRGQSVGGRQLKMNPPRCFEPKFIQQINATFITKNKPENQKIQPSKPTLSKQSTKPNDKQNRLPQQSKSIKPTKSLITKLPAVYTKVRGLHNIGNTCYLNSTLQCLLHLSKFNEAFYRGEYKKRVERSFPASSYYADIVKQLIQGNSVSPLNPWSFKMSIGKSTPRFLGSSQQDAQQFLTAVLECMNEELSRVTTKPKYQELDGDPNKKPLSQISTQWWNYNKKRDDSIICDYFTGQVLSKVMCKKCKAVSVTFDNIWGLPLSLQKGYRTIPDLLRLHFKNQNTIEDYNCSHCKKFRDCGRTLQFFRLPQVLTIQLKRFEYGKWSKEKIKDQITVEKQIDMKEFIAIEAHQQETIYKLTGMVHHFGQTDYGHYTAEVLNQENNKWCDANDSRISDVGSVEGSSKSVYMLFYQKKTKN